MHSGLAGLPRSISVPQRLLLASAALYVTVFALVIAIGRPGLGVGQGFYLAIVLAALATDAPTGAAAGTVALVLYETGELLAGRVSWGFVAGPDITFRLASYVLTGATVGWFATRARRMLAQSLHVLDELFALARREVTNRPPLARGLRAAGRASNRAPFAVRRARRGDAFAGERTRPRCPA